MLQMPIDISGVLREKDEEEISSTDSETVESRKEKEQPKKKAGKKHKPSPV